MTPIDPPLPDLPGLLARKGQARPATRPDGWAGLLVDEELDWRHLREPAAPVSVEPITMIDETISVRLEGERLRAVRIAAAAADMPVEAFVLRLLDRVTLPGGESRYSAAHPSIDLPAKVKP